MAADKAVADKAVADKKVADMRAIDTTAADMMVVDTMVVDTMVAAIPDESVVEEPDSDMRTDTSNSEKPHCQMQVDQPHRCRIRQHRNSDKKSDLLVRNNHITDRSFMIPQNQLNGNERH